MLETCPDCTARFAVGLLRCPHCQAPAPLFADRMEEDDTVPRITVAGGPSNADALPGEPGYIEPAEPAEDPTDAPAVDKEPEPVAYQDRPAADLKAELRQRGLPTGGSKTELVQRLTEADEDAKAGPED
ncbi:SAP domain-containing protein [Streptomyces sp. NPDC091215]|uniref:SAP domain-containing protein n=1 Tax=Streptomyces sp. NPDC091215 TaxID=3155192 RepID=UPI0034462B92